VDCATLQQVERWQGRRLEIAAGGHMLDAASRHAVRSRPATGRHRQDRAALRVRIGAHRVWQMTCDDSLGSSLDARLEAQIRRPRLVYAAPS
jgi:hypothetical protein